MAFGISNTEKKKKRYKKSIIISFINAKHFKCKCITFCLKSSKFIHYRNC